MKPEIQEKLNLTVILDPRLTGRDVVTGTRPDEHRPTYVFPTSHGVLRIRPFAGKFAPKIYCRFVKPYRVLEISGNFNRTNGTWNHYLWPDWQSADGSGLTIFVQRLQAIAMA